MSRLRRFATSRCGAGNKSATMVEVSSSETTFSDEISISWLDSDGAALAYADCPLAWAPRRGLLDCLGADERAQFRTLRDSKTAATWLLGRLLAKSLILRINSYAEMTWQDLSIQSRNEDNRPIRPVVWHSQQPLALSLTLSHFDRSVLVAVSADYQLCLGVDLVAPSAVKPAVQRRWFTDREQQFAIQSATVAGQIWAAKEAAYKALQRGEPFRPLRLEVTPTSPASCFCHYDAPWRPEPVKVKTWTTPAGHVAASTACARGDL